MTQLTQPGTQQDRGASAVPVGAPRHPQRQSLDQVARLAQECATEEQRIEQQHTEALAQENDGYKAKVHGARQRFARKTAELATTAEQREEEIASRYQSQKDALDAGTAAAQQQIGRTRDETDANLKKQLEQIAWQAESALVAFQMKVDTDEQKFDKEVVQSKKMIEALSAQEIPANQALARFGIEPLSVPSPFDEPMKKRIAAEPQAVLVEYRDLSAAHLRTLQEVTRTGVMDELGPMMIALLLLAIGAGIGWFVPHDAQAKVIGAAAGGGGGLVIGIVLWIVMRMRRRNRIREQAKATYEPLMQAIAIAVRAATLDPAAAAEERLEKVEEAREKRDAEVNAAQGKARIVQFQAHEKHKTDLTAEQMRVKGELARLEQEKTRSLDEMQQKRERFAQQFEKESTDATTEADATHAAALESIENEYTRDSRALDARWSDGLAAVAALIAAGSGIDPALIDWKSPAWDGWKSPGSFSGQVRIGEMKVDVTKLVEQLPKRLKLPEAFVVPALLAFPDNGSLLLETDHAGRGAGIKLAQMVMTRLLTQIPAGRVKFTILDPVGLGQSFAGFMHLADHDETLVGARIWTEKEQINQRLADLTEHMETVIQKYLRNEYASIDQYNAQAGELAEPYRFLVIADFPTGFEQETLKRLASIALTGPRCGVFTIILRDLRQPLPPGTRLEEIVSTGVRLQYKDGEFTWNDAVFKRFPLTIDPPPDDDTLTSLMDRVGKAAKDAKRVEVPFESIAPPPGQFWTMSSKDDLRVPIGKTGATRLQSLRLGVGVAQHALIAGKTGSGKSNLMHTIVTNMAMWYAPDEVEFYLVDFKKGVEFKAYVNSQLPHARAIAVESDREFGLSVLHRVDAELTRRGTMFRDVGVQEISGYRDKTGQKLPRTVLLIDEFQEFFSEDDKVGQDAAGLMDRLVRQGRAFGVHLVLGSQTIGGTSGLGRATLGQMAVRVALQCSEADSQMILGDNNSAARLLTRPGEAVYNDAGGLVEANSPFQIAFLPDAQREVFLEQVRQLTQSRGLAPVPPIVFEGNSAAAVRKNAPLMNLLQSPVWPQTASSLPGYLGEPVAIKDPTAVRFRSQPGVNVLLVGQQEEAAIGIFASLMVSLGAAHKPTDAIFYLMDGSAADSRFAGVLEKTLAVLPQNKKVVGWRQVGDGINEIAAALAQRQADSNLLGPSIYVFLFGLQRYQMLRRREDDFSFKKDDEPAAPKPDKQFADLLAEGPAHGIHTITWADTPISIERTLERSAMRQFDYRVLFQMSASDSSNLIDSPLANRLGAHRALLYSEEQGTFEKFRPYEVPDAAWLQYIAQRLTNRGGGTAQGE